MVVDRGLSPQKEAVWKVVYKKEDLMKLKWFHKNQQKLIADCERKAIRKAISPEILAEVERMRQERYQSMVRHGRSKAPDAELPDIDPHCIKNIMKPIDPNTRDLLYKSMGNLGRKLYLRERYLIPPDQRYYFPECMSWVYGWKVQENMIRARNPDEPRFGRIQVIKHSFYRRNGALKAEPEYQKPPQEQSPMVCGCI